MENRAINNIKLGAFVSGGLLFLVVLLYMIGANRSLFGATYILKARFENVQGLVSGKREREEREGAVREGVEFGIGVWLVFLVVFFVVAFGFLVVVVVVVSTTSPLAIIACILANISCPLFDII